MTRRRGRGALVPAVLVALVAGGSTAGLTAVLAEPPPPDNPPAPVALRLSEATDRLTISNTAKPAPTTSAPAPPTTSAPPTSTTTTTSTTATTTSSTPTTTTTTSTPSSREPATTTSPPPRDTSAAAQVLALTNDARAEAGCAPLAADGRLDRAAQLHSEDMSEHDYFSHTGRDGSSFVDRAKAQGHPSPGAENIARGQRSAGQVMDAWMASSGHRANILDCDLKTMGLGLDTDGWYWTQVFGR